LADVHPTVDLDLLRQLADGVRNDQIGSEDAIRALCQVFEDTFTFEVLHGQLNADLKAKVSAFLSGTPADTITARGLDPTPAPLSLYRHPFGGHVSEAHRMHHLFGGRAFAKVEQEIDAVENRPVVFEDRERTKIMQVRVAYQQPYIRPPADTSYRFTPISRSSTGSKTYILDRLSPSSRPLYSVCKT
jgi:hypothetical protein